MENQGNDRKQRKTDLIHFLQSIQRPDHPITDLDEQELLVESGLIDSLAILQIVTFLEESYNLNFLEKGIDPSELVSVGAILDVIEQKTI